MCSLNTVQCIAGMSLPAQHIEEAWQSAEFYANKILMEFRGKEPKQVSWVKLLKELLMKMRAHVQNHHRTGLAWNSGGKHIADFLQQAQAAGTVLGIRSAENQTSWAHKTAVLRCT